MVLRPTRQWPRLAVALGVTGLALTVGVPAASAHQPLFLGPKHDTPENGPRIVEGTVSFAVYTTLDASGQTRGLRATFVGGAPLLVELLIPDQEPERNLKAAELPLVTVIAPDGTPTSVESSIGEAFDEPFTSTRYIRLARLETVAVEGTYGVMVTARSAARVTIVVGREERLGEVDGAGIPGSVKDWWALPPAVAVASTVSPTMESIAPDAPASAVDAPMISAGPTAAMAVTPSPPTSTVSKSTGGVAIQSGDDEGLPPRWVLVVVPMVAVLGFGMIVQRQRPRG